MILSGGVQMSVEKRRRYDREFKLEAVRLSGEPGRSVAGVARDLGISENVLHVWQAVGHLSGLYQYGTHRKGPVEEPVLFNRSSFCGGARYDSSVDQLNSSDRLQKAPDELYSVFREVENRQ